MKNKVKTKDPKIEKLVMDMRNLSITLSESAHEITYELRPHNAHWVTEDYIANLIEKNPEIFGQRGTMRNWLKRWCYEHGIDPDHTNGIDDGEGPINAPIEK